ncbi:uncharacterized protein LOC103703129 [Phoenix dactylifera]|uniref:Uncharacterized protein LOC103703129 n=1 Tax=Phoenix dactylifera TaxID=42345 RepID=A0A8B7BRX0_PHODC|nr:uncharacterized protein LOC103703129 [Phoenix dactylifera]
MPPSPAGGDYELRHWRVVAKPSLRRRAIAIPPPLDLNGGGDLELHHWRRVDTGYTSLRDILASSPSASCGLLSPSPSSAGPGEIQIRNRLVKQAAYAYLQPTPSSWESTPRRRRGPLRRLLSVLSCGLAGSCFHFVDLFLQSIRRSRR